MIVLSEKLIREADLYIEVNHQTFLELGKRFFEKFDYDRDNNRIRSQIRNLENITLLCGALRRH